jgi:putative transposase
MSYNPDRPVRKSPRKKDADYGQAGGYFVTVCIQNRLCLLGNVVNGVMEMNAAGNMVASVWERITMHYPSVQIDAFVIMPNHLHRILFLEDSTGVVSLPQVMQWFKTMTTTAYIRGVKNHNWEPFLGKLWQRSYHDHIIRDEKDLNNHRFYIENNPARWEEDDQNPQKNTSMSNPADNTQL